ncbi:TonB protein C-terminal [Tenacibaculum sp. MAR_2009_124]|uniref:energy transducer TonB n=1 Tax=Tenacibaculum sp. MAR_2009_124 TaxID=1250059 RepID=UPI00089B0060|nr:energy transducer TonB [Tenacibaculum sp. MAR_2009_124]SEC90846.1 TonB protein C-terminal [Tenacibaculum sp. MAR_2009_124]
MKTTLLSVTIFLLSIAASAQKVCDSPKEEIIDPNSLSLSKCEVENKTKKKRSRKIIKNKNVSRKRITKRFKTNPNDLNSTLSPSNDLKTTISVTKSFKSNKLKSNTILFNVVDETPLFTTCIDKGKEENTKCFRDKIQKHFAKNFTPGNIAEDEISGKVIIKFDIKINGKVDNIEVRSKKKSKKLYNEIKCIFSKLPLIKPGKVNGLPVNVTYVFPINLTLD